MFRRVFLPVLAAVVSVSFPVAGVDAASLPALPTDNNSYYGGKVRPSTWSSGGLGGSFNNYKLRWSKWTNSAAMGRGINRYNDCEPSCAGGTVGEYAVTLNLSRVRLCYAIPRRDAERCSRA